MPLLRKDEDHVTPSPITPGDSLAAVVAELHRQCLWSLASRIERLDAEMREALDIANQRGDEWRRKFNEDTDTIADLRAKLAACEGVTDEMVEAALLSDETAVERWKGKGIPAPEILMLEAIEAALASRAAPDPGPIHPWDAVGTVRQEEPPRS
jgi:hypothetical protein